MLLSVRKVSEIMQKWGAQSNELLCGDDIEKSRRFRQQADRERFIAARILCYDTLKSHFTLETPLIFDYSELGKPSIVGFPEFSWSHSGDYVAFFCGPGAGLDIEMFSEVDTQSFNSVFTSGQLRWIGLNRFNFFTLWSIKEAVMKSTGLGFQLNPIELDPIFTNDKNDIWQLHFAHTVFYGRSVIMQNNSERNYAISFCTTDPDIKLSELVLF